MVGKVTALIVRPGSGKPDLLLFQHPHAGIQIPAGTIEPGETPAAAALREAAEETGLTQFAAVEALGYRDELLPPDERVTAQNATLYTRPAADHSYGLAIRSGIGVRVERAGDGFTQISYEEWDTDVTPPYVSYRLTGWVSNTTLAVGRRRHFFLLRYEQPTPERWQVDTDDHRFTLFWAPLAALPVIVSAQAHWVTMLPSALIGGHGSTGENRQS
jgi:8-oxo-dGTP pyrophosphatase MutT (NUDIX family)